MTGHLWYDSNMLISATEFKARCLELLDRVDGTGEVVTITKRGKVVAELRAPAYERPKGAGPGFAKGKMKILGDIIEPLDVQWEALQ
jgi:antitoxin (DNA-binding transcriptional repressor) of toxin-antitoxin stability system